MRPPAFTLDKQLQEFSLDLTQASPPFHSPGRRGPESLLKWRVLLAIFIPRDLMENLQKYPLRVQLVAQDDLERPVLVRV